MNILIYGAGAIGCHIGYCMHAAGHNVKLICRGQHYAQMKQSGMRITIRDNDIIRHDVTIKDSPTFEVLDSLDKIKNTEMDYIFITMKLMDYTSETLRYLSPFMGVNTAVIPPCTKLPFWWFYNLPEISNEKYNGIDFDPDISQHFTKSSIICMTMWVSAVLEKPGHIVIKHTQRGYPLGAVYPKMEGHATRLRKIFAETCLSPEVDDIRSEIFIKSINSFAFNMIAIDREFNNLQLNQDQHSKDSVAKIMLEGDQILEYLNIPIIQSVQSRITQTLSSTKHTMSMLHDFRIGKPIELKYLWEGFDSISKILGISMPYSEQTYQRVMAKISAHNTHDSADSKINQAV